MGDPYTHGIDDILFGSEIGMNAEEKEVLLDKAEQMLHDDNPKERIEYASGMLDALGYLAQND